MSVQLGWQLSGEFLKKIFSLFSLNIENIPFFCFFLSCFLVHPIKVNYVLFVAMQLMCAAFFLAGFKALGAAVSPVDVPTLICISLSAADICGVSSLK